MQNHQNEPPKLTSAASNIIIRSNNVFSLARRNVSVPISFKTQTTKITSNHPFLGACSDTAVFILGAMSTNRTNSPLEISTFACYSDSYR